MIQKTSIFLSILILGMILFGGTDILSSFGRNNSIHADIVSGDSDFTPTETTGEDVGSNKPDDENTTPLTLTEEHILLLERMQKIKNEQANHKITLQKIEAKKNNNMIKVGVSLLFLLVCLFIILSKKYSEETQKWAFSMLTMIGGVWIGTIV